MILRIVWVNNVVSDATASSHLITGRRCHPAFRRFPFIAGHLTDAGEVLPYRQAIVSLDDNSCTKFSSCSLGKHLATCKHVPVVRSQLRHPSYLEACAPFLLLENGSRWRALQPNEVGRG